MLIVSCALTFSFALGWKFIWANSWSLLPSTSLLVLISFIFYKFSGFLDKFDVKVTMEFLESRSNKLTLFFSANALLVLAATALGVLAEMTYKTNQASHLALVEALLSLGLFITALFSTYGVGGQLHHGQDWRFWQPFVGGVRFVILQIISWLLFCASFITAAAFIVSFYTVGLELFVGVSSSSKPF